MCVLYAGKYGTYTCMNICMYVCVCVCVCAWEVGHLLDCYFLFRLVLWHINHYLGGAHGVMVIVIGNGHGDMSSNPGRDWLHFT